MYVLFLKNVVAHMRHFEPLFEVGRDGAHLALYVAEPLMLAVDVKGGTVRDNAEGATSLT